MAQEYTSEDLLNDAAALIAESEALRACAKELIQTADEIQRKADALRAELAKNRRAKAR